MKRLLLTTAYIIGWLACGVVAGWYVDYEYGVEQDFIIFAIGGPFSLVLVCVVAVVIDFATLMEWLLSINPFK